MYIRTCFTDVYSNLFYRCIFKLVLPMYIQTCFTDVYSNLFYRCIFELVLPMYIRTYFTDVYLNLFFRAILLNIQAALLRYIFDKESNSKTAMMKSIAGLCIVFILSNHEMTQRCRLWFQLSKFLFSNFSVQLDLFQ